MNCLLVVRVLVRGVERDIGNIYLTVHTVLCSLCYGYRLRTVVESKVTLFQYRR